MSAKKENAAILGVGVVACAACCAGPILGVLTAIGLGTAAGAALFGGAAVLLGVAIVAVVLMRRRRRPVACAVPVVAGAVPVTLGRHGAASHPED